MASRIFFENGVGGAVENVQESFVKEEIKEEWRSRQGCGELRSFRAAIKSAKKNLGKKEPSVLLPSLSSLQDAENPWNHSNRRQIHF